MARSLQRYGDGLASIFGTKFGKRKYNIFGDQKSYIGSLSMFVFTFITIIIALIYYEITITYYILLVMLFISVIAALVEALTPKGLDNLTVPFVCVVLYWYILLL